MKYLDKNGLFYIVIVGLLYMMYVKCYLKIKFDINKYFLNFYDE